MKTDKNVKMIEKYVSLKCSKIKLKKILSNNYIFFIQLFHFQIAKELLNILLKNQYNLYAYLKIMINIYFVVIS